MKSFIIPGFFGIILVVGIPTCQHWRIDKKESFMSNRYVNHEALKRRAARKAEQAQEQNMQEGKIYMDDKPYDSMEDLFFNGFSKEEQDIMLGKNPYVKVV